jgi:hypothetical protein
VKRFTGTASLLPVTALQVPQKRECLEFSMKYSRMREIARDSGGLVTLPQILNFINSCPEGKSCKVVRGGTPGTPQYATVRHGWSNHPVAGEEYLRVYPGSPYNFGEFLVYR